MENDNQASFSGWAKVEVMGHQSHIGFVKTEAYGAAVLFRIDQPAMPEREYVLERPDYVDGRYTAAGAMVRRLATPGVTVLVGSGSIYRIIPCTEAAAMKAIDSEQRGPLMLIGVPQIANAVEPIDSDDYAGDDNDD